MKQKMPENESKSSDGNEDDENEETFSRQLAEVASEGSDEEQNTSTCRDNTAEVGRSSTNSGLAQCESSFVYTFQSW